MVTTLHFFNSMDGMTIIKQINNSKTFYNLIMNYNKTGLNVNVNVTSRQR